MGKIIFHVDVNSAFLSWSAVNNLKKDPKALDLRKVPSAVGGDVDRRHGIISAKSIPAKKYGIKTGMPVVKALQLCPGLILVRGDFKVYRELSRAFINILFKYTDKVQQASIDEAYMDVTKLYEKYSKPDSEGREFPVNLAYRIKNEIRDTLGFTVNVGVSVNKLLAKTASDMEKPDKVHTLFPEEIPEKFWPMPIEDLHGCGRALSARLISLGIKTVGEVSGLSLDVLQGALGEKTGEYLYYSSRGIGSQDVTVSDEDRKSCSNEITTPEDITSANFRKLVPDILDELSESVSERLKKKDLYAETVFVSAKTAEFKRHSRQEKLDIATNDKDRILSSAEKLLRELCFGNGTGSPGLFSETSGIRLVGVGTSGLTQGEARQLSIFDIDLTEVKKFELEHEKIRKNKDKLDRMVKKINSSYGSDRVYTGKDRN